MSSGGLNDPGRRAELQEQPFEPGQSGHIHHEPGHHAVAVSVDLADGDRLGDPASVRGEFEVDLVGAGTRHEHVLGRAGPTNFVGDGLVELVGLHDAVDPEAPHVARPMTVGIEIPVPIHSDHLHRLHHPRRELVTGGGEVFELQVLSGLGGGTYEREIGRRVDIEPDRLARAQRVLQFGQRPTQGIVVGAGHGEQQAGRGGHGEPLGRRQASWPGVLRRKEGAHRMLGDLDLHQRVRRVGRCAATGGQLELGHQLLLAHAEALCDVGHGRLAHLSQPPHHGEEATEATARLRSGCRADRGRLRFRRRGAGGAGRAGGAGGASGAGRGVPVVVANFALVVLAGSFPSVDAPSDVVAEEPPDDTRASSQATMSSRKAAGSITTA